MSEFGSCPSYLRLSLVLVQPFPPWTGILLSAGSEDTGASWRLSGRMSSSSRRGPRNSSAVGPGICRALRHPPGRSRALGSERPRDMVTRGRSQALTVGT